MKQASQQIIDDLRILETERWKKFKAACEAHTHCLDVFNYAAQHLELAQCADKLQELLEEIDNETK